jgi:hypothetical protein
MSAPALDSSRERVLGTAADGGIVLAHAAAARAVAAWTLAPAPRDPVRHLEGPTRRRATISADSPSTIRPGRSRRS